MQRDCPYCAEKIKKRAKICRFCSAEIDPIYVENVKANKQICKIMNWHQVGDDVNEIVSKMNESGDLTLDKNEPWSADRIKTIVSSFGMKDSEIASNSANSVSQPNNALKNAATSGELRTEQCQCFCTKCNESQNEILSFSEGNCNHVLHAVLTLLTFVWGIVWIISFAGAQNNTKQNRKLAAANIKCSKCGGNLILVNG